VPRHGEAGPAQRPETPPDPRPPSLRQFRTSLPPRIWPRAPSSAIPRSAGQRRAPGCRRLSEALPDLLHCGTLRPGHRLAS
jgi:hypothetical protein